MEINNAFRFMYRDTVSRLIKEHREHFGILDLTKVVRGDKYLPLKIAFFNDGMTMITTT